MSYEKILNNNESPDNYVKCIKIATLKYIDKYWYSNLKQFMNNDGEQVFSND